MSTPFFTFLMRIPSQSYEFSRPVSAFRALTMRSKLQLLMDVSTQTRINWVSTSTEAGPNTYWLTTAGSPAIGLFMQEFEHGWLRPEWPTGLDIVVAIARGTGGTTNVDAAVRIVPASSPANDLSVEPYYTATLTTTGVSTQAEVSEQVFFDTRVDQRGKFIEHSTLEDSARRSVRQGLARIEIAVRVPDGSQGGIVEVLVREFVCR